MKRINYQDPAPNWTEVVVLWDQIMNHPRYPIREILSWIDHAPGGCYHLHGYDSTNGFAFRFERAKDATYFKLKWL
jgi:hypothetical protein